MLAPASPRCTSVDGGGDLPVCTRNVAPANESAARTGWVAAALVAATHIALKGFHLGSSSLWLDEAVAVHISQQDLLGIIQASRQDTTPPLYYLLLGGFERMFGFSEAAVRWPSVLASGATSAVLFLLARRRLGNFAAWLASALFLLSDTNLRYAREARPYALASLLCALSFALFLRALERPSRRAWAAVAAMNGLMIFTHYVAVFAIGAQGIALVWPWRGWPSVRRFAVAHAVIGAVFIAWVVPILLGGQYLKMDWLPAPTLPQLGRGLGWSAGGRRGTFRLAALLVMAGFAFALARSRGRPVQWRLLAPLVLWSSVPALLAFGASFYVRCLHPRYLLYATSALVLLWAAAVQALPQGRSRLMGAAFACAVPVIGFGATARRPELPDWRHAAEMLRAHPAARVLVSPPWEYPTLAYYYDPEAFRDAAHTSRRLARDGVSLLDEAADAGALDLGLAREVLLVVGGPGSRRRGIERQLASEGLTLVERCEFGNLSVSRLAREPSMRAVDRFFPDEAVAAVVQPAEETRTSSLEPAWLPAPDS